MVNPDRIMESIVDGERWGVFMDDTKNQPSGRHPDRRAWAALVVPPGRRAMFEGLYATVDSARRACGVAELHFSSLYGRRDGFAELDRDDVLTILDDFVRTTRVNALHIVVVQAHKAQMLRENERTGGRLTSLPYSAVKMIEPDVISHFSALFYATLMIRAEDADARIAAFSDHWDRREPEMGHSPPVAFRLDPEFILYCESKRYPALQLADFAVWSFGRLELLRSRMPFQDARDHALFEVLAPLQECIYAGTPYPDDRRDAAYHWIADQPWSAPPGVKGRD
jgi:hypothetical protein